MNSSLQLAYTPAEALDLIKEYYPETWETRLIETTIGITLLANNQEITVQIAYDQLLARTKSMPEMIELIAARHFLNLDIKIYQINQIKEKQKNVGLQAAAMEEAEFISYDDKKTLRSHYLKLQEDYQKEIDRLSVEPKTDM